MKKGFILILTVLLYQFVCAQEYSHAEQEGTESIEQEEKEEPPAFKLFRAEEDYGYLQNEQTNPYEKDYLDAVKYIPITDSGDVNLRFGGEFRPRVEYFQNRGWENENDVFYSQRLSVHSLLNISKYFRLYGELYHGLISDPDEEFAESDELDMHQGFAELKLPMKRSTLRLRVGRQEMAFGATRLIGLREGPNIRRSFDMGRLIYQREKFTSEFFYGKEVSPKFGMFDNRSGLFDHSVSGPTLWGVYTQFVMWNDPGKMEVYYLGFDTPVSFYNDASGQDERHTIGARRFGKLWKAISHNTEAMFQIGETGGKQVTAWALETDWKYTFWSVKLKPEFDVKLELISGDETHGDNKIQTFNPMFTNPAHYSLAGLIAPVNLIEYHPSFSIKPNEKSRVYIEWASFYRYSLNDGVYSPPRFLNRSGHTSNERLIGHQIGVMAEYEFGRHLTFDFDLSYFIAGDFIKATGSSANALHMAPTVSYKF